jgi:type II secretory pathway component PulC
MSIIYDALKKVEKNISLEPKVEKLEKTRLRFSKALPRLYLVYILVACIGVFLGNALFNLLTYTKSISFKQIKPSMPRTDTETIQSAELAKPLPQPEEKIELRESFVLNGIFFSDNEGYALINNQIVKAGDTIKGATVKDIKLNEVELETATGIIRLK